MQLLKHICRVCFVAVHTYLSLLVMILHIQLLALTKIKRERFYIIMDSD